MIHFHIAPGNGGEHPPIVRVAFGRLLAEVVDLADSTQLLEARNRIAEITAGRLPAVALQHQLAELLERLGIVAVLVELLSSGTRIRPDVSGMQHLKGGAQGRHYQQGGNGDSYRSRHRFVSCHGFALKTLLVRIQSTW